MSEAKAQEAQTFLHDMRVYRRGPDDLVTGVAVVATGSSKKAPNDLPPETLQLTAPATGAVHVDAYLFPRRYSRSAVPAKLGGRHVALITDGEIELEPDREAAAMCLMRRPRWFGRTCAAFLLAGSENPDRTMAHGLGAIGAIWPFQLHLAACLFLLATAGFGGYCILGAVDAQREAGFISAISAVQYALIGAAVGYVLRLIVKPLSLTMNGIFSLLVLTGIVAGSFVLREDAVRRYEPFAPLLDPAGYVLETVGEPTEAMLATIREELAPRRRETEPGQITYLCNFWDIGCKEKVAIIMAFDDRVGASRATICDRFIDKLNGPNREDQCAQFRRSIHADLFWGSLALIFSLASCVILIAMRRRTVRDMSLMVWAGGAPMRLNASD